jgi:hypothetical protein
MGEAIGQSLPLAIGVALSPVPIIAVVLMLTTPRARANGPAFVLGWLVGLGVVGATVLALAGPGGASEQGQPATWVSWLKLLLGLGLLLVAVRQFRGRPHQGEEASLPKWMGAIDRFAPGQALGGGAALAAANPKNQLLAVGAAAAIAQLGIPGGLRRLRRHRDPRRGGAGGPLLRDGDAVGGAAGPPEGLDGPQQRRDHGGAVPGDRREAGRRRPQRAHVTAPARR